MHPFYANDGRLVAISHAGDTSSGERSGSLGAYSAARELGFQYFQIDVVLVGGGELVAAHAISGRRRSWERETLSQLRQTGHALHSVHEILEAIPDGKWNLEIKSAVAADALIELLRAQKSRTSRFGISAPFNRRLLARVRREFGDELCTNASLLEGSLLGVPLIPLRSQHADAVQVFHPLARSRRVVERNRRLGVQFQAWPANSERAIRRLLGLGVRGIITDEHRLLRELLRQRDEWPADARL